MAVLDTTDFRRGLKVEFEGELYVIVDYQHVKMGRGGAKVKTKMRNLSTGSIIERNFISGTTFTQPDFEWRELQYQYSDQSGYHFMDAETYDQMQCSGDELGDARHYLVENQTYRMSFYRGRLMEVELAAHAFLTITDTEPTVKGDTVTNVLKRAVTDTGLVVQVPLFVDVGDRIKVDTRTGEYLERA